MGRKHLLSVGDLRAEEIYHLLEKALNLKKEPAKPLLKNKTLALLFEKPSLRTKVSFSVAMFQLGGNCIFLPKEEIGMGSREEPSDIAQVLSRYVHGLVYRTFSHQVLETLAQHASIPVINGLSEAEHPCQALSDLLTIYEKRGGFKGLKLAYIGDANNVAHSLILACSLVGLDFAIANPPGYDINSEIVAKAKDYSRNNGAILSFETDPFKAVTGADIVYTDVWTSMGQEAEAGKRRKDFAGYQVNSALIAAASSQVLFMHPLPAHHGEEVTREVLQGSQSIIYDQAENRLHMQKALLIYLL